MVDPVLLLVECELVDTVVWLEVVCVDVVEVVWVVQFLHGVVVVGVVFFVVV